MEWILVIEQGVRKVPEPQAGSSTRWLSGSVTAVQIVIAEAEVADEQQLPDVGLHGGLAAHPLAIGEATSELGELVGGCGRIGGHADGLSRAPDRPAIPAGRLISPAILDR